eukprot:TRINITY_DN8516_c0_g1_i1.p1 TRINITY_DN8516_c0_g1~~TRINITY_DN8516_c0_g1_i1.p1  ORF type:complete len:249 (-),score=36.56 TRINITY_DN8516_c0_g1_i1:97-843(-)
MSNSPIIVRYPQHLQYSLAVGLCCFTSPSVDMSAEPSADNAKLKTVVEWVQTNPMGLAGIEMHYTAQATIPDSAADLADQLDSLDLVDPSSANRSSIHTARVAHGLLYVGVGALDLAHNAVTPLSWPYRTRFSGEPERDVEESVAADASYVHALIHRREGEHIGEFGSGWNNSLYWFGNVPSDHAVLVLMQKLYPRLYGKGPDVFLGYCEKAIAKKDQELLLLCQEVCNAEWKLLLEYCLDKMKLNHV